MTDRIGVDVSNSSVFVASCERWLPVVGWEDFYEVSDHGHVRSLDRTVTFVSKWGTLGHRLYHGRLLAPAINRDGHLRLGLCRRPRFGLFFVHRLVLLAFVGPQPVGMQGCHNDGNPQNNFLSNLRWDTCSNNNLDKQRHGTCHLANRTHCPRRHRLSAPNLRRQATGRACLACHRAFSRHYAARKAGRPFDMQAVSDQIYTQILRAGEFPAA